LTHRKQRRLLSGDKLLVVHAIICRRDSEVEINHHIGNLFVHFETTFDNYVMEQMLAKTFEGDSSSGFSDRFTSSPRSFRAKKRHSRVGNVSWKCGTKVIFISSHSSSLLVNKY
jgi:ribosomal protein L32